MLKKRFVQSIITLAALALGSTAMAATSASWLTPANNSSFLAGTTVNVTGQAAGRGQTGGTGLDLVLVMDSSGSMGGDGQPAQKTAALALVAGLPQATTSVSIVDFDRSASTAVGLTQLNGTNSAVNAAINGIDASGSTAIHAGINQAASVLNGAGATTSRLQAMVVMSDGGSSVSLANSAADAAVAAGVEAIHSVGMGNGYSEYALQAAVNGGDDIYGNADDYGTFVGAEFTKLLGIFDGTSGNLVGLDHIDLILPDGTLLADYAFDGFGNFNVNYTLALGANVFQVNAFGDDGTSATAYWTLHGDSNSNSVPEPATMLLFGTGIVGLIGYRRKTVQK